MPDQIDTISPREGDTYRRDVYLGDSLLDSYPVVLTAIEKHHTADRPIFFTFAAPNWNSITSPPPFRVPAYQFPVMREKLRRCGLFHKVEYTFLAHA
jgi:hypothetical protein